MLSIANGMSYIKNKFNILQLIFLLTLHLPLAMIWRSSVKLQLLLTSMLNVLRRHALKIISLICSLHLVFFSGFIERNKFKVKEFGINFGSLDNSWNLLLRKDVKLSTSLNLRYCRICNTSSSGKPKMDIWAEALCVVSMGRCLFSNSILGFLLWKHF